MIEKKALPLTHGYSCMGSIFAIKIMLISNKYKQDYMNLFKTSVIFYIISIIGCKNKTETISPKIENIIESVYASGIIKSLNQYEVSSKTMGSIKIIYVKEGQTLKKGDPIAKIENINSELIVDNALLLSKANEYEDNMEKISEAKESIRVALQKLNTDSLQFERQKILWNQNIGSKIELEQKELNYENAKVNFAKSKNAYNDLKKQLKLISDQSKNNLRIAQETANDLIIRSEVNGIVYKINMAAGELTSPSSPIAIIGQDSFVIELNIDEFDIAKIKKGQKVVIKMDSYKDQVFEAEISFIYPIMDERTRLFKAQATFKKGPDILYPNLSLEANIIIREEKNATTIPVNYLINDSTVILGSGEKARVEIGLKDNSVVEIKSGIDKDTKIRMPDNEK